MQLDIITGKTIKLASREVVRRIELSNDLNLNNFVVVPDRVSMQMEKMIFEELNISSTFNINVVSISKLAKLILKLAGNAFSAQNNAEGALLIYKILIDNKNELNSFKDANLSIDLAKEIYLTISQLKSCEISAQNFLLSAKGSSSQKLLDLAKVYLEYENLNKEKIDASDLINLFQKQIENSEVVKNSNFYFAEFDSFTAQVETVLKLLVKSAKKVVVGAPFSSAENSYIYEKDILQKLTNICKELSLTPNIIQAENNLNDFQLHIMDNLFVAKQNVREINNEVSILKSSSPLEEVEKVANIIKFEILEKGRKFKDFNIIISSIDTYAKYIEEIFSFENISFYTDQNVTLKDLPLTQYIFTLFNFFKEKNIANFLQVITSNISGLSGEDIFFINSLIEKDGKGIEFFKPVNFSDKENIFKFLEKLEKIEKKYEKISNFKEFIEILNEIYLVFEFENVVNIFIERFKMAGDLKNEKIYEQYESKFERAKRELTNLTLSAELNFDEMIFITSEIFENVIISGLPLSVDAVFIGESVSSFFEERKISIFLGCNAGELPLTRKDTGIILDGEVEKYNLKIEPTMQMLNRRSKFKLFNDALLASEKIYLSQSGNGVLSEFVKNFSKMFSVSGKELPISDDFYIFATNDKELIKKNLTFTSLLNSNILEIEKFLEDKKTIQSEIIEDIENVLYPKKTTSITRAQSFFACPFAHFARYGLLLKELEKAEIDHLDIGNYFHAFAEKFLGLAKSKNYKLQEKELEEFTFVALKFAKNNSRIKKLCELDNLKGYFKFLDLQARTFARELLKQIEMSAFKPEDFEKGFEIGLDVDGYKLIGKIDRIDSDGEWCRVIDYKTGESKIDLSKMYSGRQLQLLVYVLAINDKVAGAFYSPVFESNNNKDKKLCGYFEKDTQVIKKLDKTLSVGKLKSDIINLSLTAKSTNTEFKVYARAGALEVGNLHKFALYAKKVVEDGVRESLTGRIDALPAEDKICESCPYYSLCEFSVNFGECREKISGIKEEKIISLLEK